MTTDNDKYTMKKLLAVMFKTLKTIINIFIIVIGPAVSVWIVKMNKGDSSENWTSFYLATLVFGIISVVIAVIVYKLHVKSAGVVIKATVFSTSACVALTWGYIFIIERSSSGLMWLPVIIFFMAITLFPMTYSVSLGTIRILKDFKFFEKEIK